VAVRGRDLARGQLGYAPRVWNGYVRSRRVLLQGLPSGESLRRYLHPHEQHLPLTIRLCLQRMTDKWELPNGDYIELPDMGHYDRNGQRIGLFEWAQLHQLPGYLRVASTTLPNGVHVSTVWLGIDHSFDGEGPPIIFETMAFEPEVEVSPYFSRPYHPDLGIQRRYATEEEALRGHAEVVAELLAEYEKIERVIKESAHGESHTPDEQRLDQDSRG